MSGDQPRPHRPALFSDLTEMIDAAGGDPMVSRAELASATAEVVVRSGRSPGDGAPGDGAPGDGELFVALADRVGIETLAALWRDSDPVSLPGALWALYLLRQWCRDDAEDVVRLWRAGEPLAPAEAVVAGVADVAGPEDVRAFADTVLAGIYQRDLAVALERAAGFFRVVAAGRRSLDSDPALAGRNDRVAASLAAAAARWRAGTLH